MGLFGSSPEKELAEIIMSYGVRTAALYMQLMCNDYQPRV